MPPPKEMHLADVGIIKLQKRRGTRNLRLSFMHDGTPRVSIPYWLPFAAGEAFARQHIDWLKQHRPAQSAPIVSMQQIGKAGRIELQAANQKTISAHVSGNHISVKYPLNTNSLDSRVQAKARAAGERYLKTEAQHLLPARLAELAIEHGLSYQSVTIKKLRSRWGSCSNQKEIALSYFLMLLPWSLIDYVLLHELAHTRHMHHGKPFWAFMAELSPNHKTIRKTLKLFRPAI